MISPDTAKPVQLCNYRPFLYGVMVAALLLFEVVFSGAIAAAPVIKSSSIPTLSTRQGLSQDSINDILIDDTGYVWIATQGGLDRWDGHHLINIGGPDNILVNASVERLYLDSHDQLWISSLESGVFTLDLTTSEVSLTINRPGLSSYQWVQAAVDFKEDSHGDLFVALEHEIVKVKREAGSEVVYSLPASLRQNEDIIRAIYPASDYLFIATSAGLYALNLHHDEARGARTTEQEDRQAQKVDYLGDIPADVNNQNAKFLMADQQNRLWLGTVKGLFKIDLTTLQNDLVNARQPEFDVVNSQQNIWQIVPDGSNSFWLATNEGLFSLRKEISGSWRSIHMLEAQSGERQLAKAKIKTIAKDKLNTLWLGTEMGGAMLWTPDNQNITHIQNLVSDPEPPLTNNIIWSLYEDDEDILWAGTGNGLTRLDLTTLESSMFLHDPSAQFDEAEIAQILPAGNNKLYLRTAGKVKIFNKLTGEAGPLPVNSQQAADILKGWIYGMSVDTQGRLYFLSHNYYRYDPSTQTVEKLAFSDPRLQDGYSGYFLGTAAELDNNMLLSTSDGVWAVDTQTLETRLLYEYLPAEKASDASATSWEIQEGILWLGFPRFGLLGIDLDSGRVIRRFNSDNLLKTDIVYGIKADKQGSLWFSSHQGVFRFSPENRLIKEFVYGRELNVSEFNDGAALILNDGRIAYGSTGGIAIFDPSALKDGTAIQRPEQPMVISGVSLDSRDLPLPMKNLSNSHLDLHHDDFGIEIHFSSILASFDAADNYVYELNRNGRLLSQSVTAEGKAAFAFLGPGEYQFKVAPTTERYDYNVTPGVLTFTIPYPPFQSPLAYTVYVILFVAAAWGYVRFRQKAVEQLARTERQLKVMGEAFSQTRDWVIVFDEKMLPMAVNPAFCRALGLSEHDTADDALSQLYRRKPAIRQQIYEPLLSLEPGGFIKRETTVHAADGRHHDVIIDISAVADDSKPDCVDYYLMVFSDISEQKEAERKLVKMASYDSLTGLLNRNLLLDRLSHAIDNAQEDATKVAVLFIDLDRFKGINDSLGHGVGDKLLKVIAERMISLSSHQDTVARLGGDEFVIVRERVECTDTLSSFVAHLIETVETPIAIDGEILCISCSIGISFYPDDAVTPAELIKQADVAMYTAKKDTVDGFTYFTAEMNDRARQQMVLENRVKLAYQEDRFYNQYQPIVDALSGNIEGVELLLRCDMPDAPMTPCEFIPVLEQLRYIVDVTRMAIVRALDDLACWQEQGFHGYVSVNISALQFKVELHLDALRKMMYERNLTERSMRFEITEGLLMEDSELAQARIKEFQDAGFLFSLDDFGTGYSSLSYLKKFPLDVLKIDKSFIEEVDADPQAAALVKTTIELAKTFNMECVAEGVETLSQAETLQLFGCYNHQGYYYSKPVPADQITALIKQHWSEVSSV
ncbi:EAL domain-containing protein [Salinimonas sp. HHU 13199]|uniref:EAL domain-containing protein n=1 Tax=Salinimonas profundi TaxID=2729140 RepID=A0ABR8LET1_9ALTE|nr:EAL domain-containing protein [Salinimonas profundi]MBD3584227.1 EAL domain-containing protein [Salinimonas profundi]